MNTVYKETTEPVLINLQPMHMVCEHTFANSNHCCLIILAMNRFSNAIKHTQFSRLGIQGTTYLLYCFIFDHYVCVWCMSVGYGFPGLVLLSFFLLC